MSENQTETKPMSREDYYALHGLMQLAKQHFDAMQDIESAVMKLVGESEEGGHASDAIWSPGYRTPDELVKIYGFEVQEDSA